MYIAIGCHMTLAAGYASRKEALDALGINAVELIYSRNDEVESLVGKELLRMDMESGRRILKEQLLANNVKICAFFMSNNFMNEDLKKELDWAVRCVETAKDLGIEVVRIDPVMRGEENMSLEEAADKAVRCLSKIIEMTHQIDVCLAVENHHLHGNNPEFLDNIIKGVNSPRIGLTMDTANFYWSGKPLGEVHEILKHFAPHAKHTHIKNIKYPYPMRNQPRPIGWEFAKYICPIPEGDIDHKEVVNFLRNSGYKGALAIEEESIEDDPKYSLVSKYPLDRRRQVLRNDVDYLRTLINEK
jgi:sugar phosphate isomerase/epimerase